MTERQIAIKTSEGEPPGMRVIRVECADEMTEYIFVGPVTFPFETDHELLKGEAGEQFMQDHVRQCEACQKWMNHDD